MTRIVRGTIVRPSRRMIAFGGLLALFATGCVSEADLSSLRKEQRDLARRLADTRADVENLRSQLSRLRAQIEDGGSRPRATAPPPAPAPVAPPPSASVPGGETVSIDLDMGRSTNEEYRAGLTQYQRGDTQKAVQTLRAVVNKNPKNELVPYAQYWIGESYYGQGKYNEAILAYNEVLVGFPKSDRVPAAMLRQASAFAEMGDKIDARLILKKLTEQYPQTPEAARAKQMLLSMGN